MANLIIDIGNTALKAAWADGVTLGRTFRYQGERMMDFIMSLMTDQRPEILILSSVRHFSEQNINILEKGCDKLVVINPEVNKIYGLPDYLTPDRTASIVASRYLFKGRGCTIFDLGTTLTVDFIDSDGKFNGGNI